MCIGDPIGVSLCTPGPKVPVKKKKGGVRGAHKCAGWDTCAKGYASNFDLKPVLSLTNDATGPEIYEPLPNLKLVVVFLTTL